MKTNFSKFGSIVLVLSMAVCAYSCTKEEPETTPEKVKSSKYIPDPIVLPTDHLEWDESYHPYDKTTRANNESDQMAVTSSNVFLGAVYTGKSIENLTYDWIQKPIEPIYVTFTFPRYYFDEIQRPSVSGMYQSLQKATDSSEFSGEQSLGFEYDMRQFFKYSELKLAFGANLNIATFFKLDASVNYTNIKSKSGLFVRVVQKNFSMIMDYPYDGNIFLNNDDLNGVLSKSPVYINSIIFGRMAIIAIESDYSFDELRSAVKASFSAGIVGGEINISAEQKKILQESTMRLCVTGGKGSDVAKIVEGYDKFNEFIVNGGEFTKEVPGAPIFFTANYAEDNSVFRTSFATE
ncbi:thiol-activated cytolysin family protein [Alistipes sp. kh20]|uniref:thiol-activated cytolysin family protein n=1 Tax=Alistipes montrealensis TaxID=2834113 RepID=UPI001BD0A175|nr:thiol-activated cytolysin family protein [Alistipes montrealensis]MBS4764938.1 thiol-activated cytolysin family protein [Alistipes montrealensis]